MAYENGNNIYDYCQPIFEMYKKDQLIFLKALQIVQHFISRSDYPFCLPELDRATEKILGESISDMSFGVSKYVIHLDERMVWEPRNAMNLDPNSRYDEEKDLLEGIPEEEGNQLAERFKNDLQSFCITLDPVFNKIFSMNRDLMSVDKIIADTLGSDNNQIIRIMRNDGQYLDIKVDKNEISDIIDALKQIKRKFNGE